MSVVAAPQTEQYPCVVCGEALQLNWVQRPIEVMDPQTGEYRIGCSHMGCTTENELRPAERAVRACLRDAIYLAEHRNDADLHPDAWEMFVAYARKALAINGLIKS